MEDYGYETGKTGFTFGSMGAIWWFIFSPKLSVFHESLDTNQSASAKLKKQEGEYFDTAFAYGLD